MAGHQHSYRASGIQGASPHGSEQGQEQMPRLRAPATQPVAQRCAEQQLCGPEDTFKVTKSRPQIFKTLPL